MYTVIEENAFSKHFKCDNDVELFVHKAHDEGKPFLLFLVPKFDKYLHIRYPVEFATDEERDELFNNVNPDLFLKALTEEIESKKAEHEDNKV